MIFTRDSLTYSSIVPGLTYSAAVGGGARPYWLKSYYLMNQG